MQPTVGLLQHNTHEELEQSWRVSHSIHMFENRSDEIGPASHSLAQLAWSPSWSPAAHSTRHISSSVNSMVGSPSQISADMHARQLDAPSRTHFQPWSFPRVEANNKKPFGEQGRDGVPVPPSVVDSTPQRNLRVLVLFLALVGAVPLGALAREHSPPWLTWRSARADSCRRASPPVLSAGQGASLPGTASVQSSTINLAKCMVGSTVLALSAGIASFSSAPGGVVPALVMLLFFTFAAGYTYSVIARVVNEVGTSTYTGTWAKLFGKSTAFIPISAVIFETLVTGLSYAIIIGDSLASIACLSGLPEMFCLPNIWIVVLSALLLFPLSLPRKLSSLAIGSAIGTIGVGYTAFFMWLRMFDRSYAVGGKFHDLIDQSARPLFTTSASSYSLLNPSLLVLVSMLSLGLSVHYTAPIFFRELKEPTDGSSKMKSFDKVVKRGFALAALLFASIMVGGYLTFGGASQGLILNSYATSDHLAVLARLGNCASIIFAYPLNLVVLRKALCDIFRLDGSRNIVNVCSTFALVCIITAVSLVMKDLGLVAAIGGALGGSAVVYMFPSLMFIQATRLKRKKLEAEGVQLSSSRLREMYASYGICGLGVALAVLGVWMSLKGALSH